MSGARPNGLWLLAALLTGCACESPFNPSFPLTDALACEALEEMEEKPHPLTRPVIVVGGYMDPGIGVGSVVRRIRKLTGDDRVHGVSFGCVWTFESCREKVLERIERIQPSDDPNWTTEVDVVALSMGGVIARYAASSVDRESEDPSDGVHRRLKIARLFTISTPHRGSVLADVLPAWNLLHLELRSSSPFLRRLNADTEPLYEIYPYVRLGDRIVGERNAIPPYDEHVWWVSTTFFQAAHLGAIFDPRIIADIVRRLRGETPFARLPRAPLPNA